MQRHPSTMLSANLPAGIIARAAIREVAQLQLAHTARTGGDGGGGQMDVEQVVGCIASGLP